MTSARAVAAVGVPNLTHSLAHSISVSLHGSICVCGGWFVGNIAKLLLYIRIRANNICKGAKSGIILSYRVSLMMADESGD